MFADDTSMFVNGDDLKHHGYKTKSIKTCSHMVTNEQIIKWYWRILLYHLQNWPELISRHDYAYE